MRSLTALLPIILLIGSFAVWTTPCGADDDVEYWSDTYLDRMNDWIVTIDINPLQHYLEYPNSGMKPLVNSKVSYRLVPKRNSRDVDPRPVRYEDIWYRYGVACGLKRYHALLLPKDKIGVIMVKRNDNIYDQTRAIANSIVRLTLDIDLRSCVITDVIVPKEIYDGVSSDLGQFRFFARNELAADGGQQLLIHLLSNPKGSDRYFLFDKGDNSSF